ncbi:acylneuraminate cytidylyltransferase family protein [Zhenhengia yiwuensis]|uniref:Acylneuraminate cytidylyltransferase family protein n=1 Tax=Zhenhengia yiwuensis TaxID=2763666 RepID=A0A926IDK8_9FIRM|nr:acylneuraminate cytidylyltransferase family protein [Zhenhengia yiwuensis]MBC8578964.1 acylneuraminate cytidylyltransferase family protein [Zhenhengia yiwuensis]
MYKDKKILAIIPARGGSKGIKNKNIVDLCNRPLISYSIIAALESKYIDKVVVSTDSEEIAEVARNYDAEVPFLRPKEFASDTAKTIDAVMHCIETLEEMGQTYDYLVLLQPTQPLRQAYHIDEAIELLMDKDEVSLISVRRVIDHPILIRTIDEVGNGVNLMNQSSTQRRQDFKQYYKVNGSIYINKIDQLTYETSLNDNKVCYIMEDQYDIDIDEHFDLSIAELKLTNLKSNNKY